MCWRSRQKPLDDKILDHIHMEIALIYFGKQKSMANTVVGDSRGGGLDCFSLQDPNK